MPALVEVWSWPPPPNDVLTEDTQVVGRAFPFLSWARKLSLGMPTLLLFQGHTLFKMEDGTFGEVLPMSELPTTVDFLLSMQDGDRPYTSKVRYIAGEITPRIQADRGIFHDPSPTYDTQFPYLWVPPIFSPAVVCEDRSSDLLVSSWEGSGNEWWQSRVDQVRGLLPMTDNLEGQHRRFQTYSAYISHMASYRYMLSARDVPASLTVCEASSQGVISLGTVANPDFRFGLAPMCDDWDAWRHASFVPALVEQYELLEGNDAMREALSLYLVESFHPLRQVDYRADVLLDHVHNDLMAKGVFRRGSR